MGKARKEGRKKKSRKSVLKTIKMIKNNEKLINEYKEQKK
jgi:hypothetical protein